MMSSVLLNEIKEELVKIRGLLEKHDKISEEAMGKMEEIKKDMKIGIDPDLKEMLRRMLEDEGS